MKRLYFGDNLNILREYVADESVDLIYLDPPFNSRAQYNVLFQSPQDDAETAQAQAFRDTWAWGNEAERAYEEIMHHGGATARLIDALRSALAHSDMMAYLVMMAVRLQVLHSKLKSTGSLYLHCDPTASHYLKIVLDSLFGPVNFRSEIIWKRTFAHGNVTTSYGDVTDTILYYVKGTEFTWNQQFRKLTSEQIEAKYPNRDADGRRWQSVTLRNPGVRPNLHFPFTASNGITYQPHPNGWSCNLTRLRLYDKESRLHFPSNPRGALRLKMYEDESRGERLQSLWDDIPPIGAQAQERLGYPTQKPIALLERIIAASSNKGDTVLDPFCGCGTTIEAAERASRNWIGIDVAIHAIKVIERRLADFEQKNRHQHKVVFKTEGIPNDFGSAKRLAERDKYQFQWWANYLFNPHALREQRRGPDRGIDGEIFFPNGPGRPWGRMLTSVKGGEQVGPAMVRDFARVLERENAELGLFICLYPPTREMRREAASMRFADVVHGDIPRLQIVSIEEWFKGKRPLLPPLEHLPPVAFSGPRRPTRRPPRTQQLELPFTFIGGRVENNTLRHFNPEMVRKSG